VPVAELRPGIVAADVLFLLLLGLDLLSTPRISSWTVDRSIPARVGLGRVLERRILLRHPRLVRRIVEAHEQFPQAFEVVSRTWDAPGAEPDPADPSGGADRVRTSEAGEAVLLREYRSDLRGAFSFGDVRLRARGRLGLMLRHGRLSGEQLVEVEPALANLRETLLLAASDRWQDLGVRLLRRHGGETEFESLREYVSGDDVRRVDWKAFARRGKPMVREYQVERGQELILLVDAGRRMRASVETGRRRGWTKLDWALDAAFELAAVALTKGDRVGMGSLRVGLETWVPPAKGALQLTRLSRAHFHLQPSADDPDLTTVVRQLAARHRRRATVILVSDVADPGNVDVQRRALAAASARHRIVFAALDDPDPTRLARGRKAEDPLLRAAAIESVRDRAESLRELAASRTRVVDALPAEMAGPLLAAWLEERRRA